MVIKKNQQEIQWMDEANRMVRKILDTLSTAIKPGISTWALEEIAEREIANYGAETAFKGYQGYPCSLCVSLNEEIVHGIPSKKRLMKEGDLVSLDFGVKWKGYFGDSAITVPVGEVSEARKTLMDVTRDSMYCGIKAMKVGARLSDISHAVQTYVEAHGFGVVRDFVGHGIGASLHEDPQLPNYGPPGRGPVLEAGMVLAIEPMVTEKSYDAKIADDGWTVSTRDGGWAAHFEKSVLVADDNPRILGL